MGKEDLVIGGFAYRRERFHRNVIQPLLDLGMRPPKGMSKTAFGVMLKKLSEDLAWVEPNWHDPLREVIQRRAARSKQGDSGSPRDICPTAMAIIDWAVAMTDAAKFSQLEGSWMRSREGPDAWSVSPYYASALMAYLRRNGPPSGDLAYAQIREAAIRLEGDVRRAEQNAALDDDAHDFLKRWRRRRDAIEVLVFEERHESVA